MSANLSAIFYLISGVLFILALRGLSSPETSRQGNFFGILGMLIAITVTFLSIGNFSSGFIFVVIFFSNWWCSWSIHSVQNSNDSNARISGRFSQSCRTCSSFCCNFSILKSNSFQSWNTR